MDAFAELSLRLEKLNATHNVTTFDSQAMILDTFLREAALGEKLRDISQTYLLIGTSFNRSEDIIGYFSLEADSFYGESGADGRSRSIPVVHITHLARHKALRGQRVSSVLMYQVMRIVAEASGLVGIAGIHLAHTQEGRKLYERFRFGPHPYGESNMFLPIATVREFASLDAQI